MIYHLIYFLMRFSLMTNYDLTKAGAQPRRSYRASQSYILMCRKCSKSSIQHKIPLFWSQMFHQVKNLPKNSMSEGGAWRLKFYIVPVLSNKHTSRHCRLRFVYRVSSSLSGSMVESRLRDLFIYFLIFSTQLFSTQLFFVFHATLVLPDRKQQCLHTSTKIILMLENHATNSSSDLGFQYFSLIYQNLKEKFVSDSTTRGWLQNW